MEYNIERYRHNGVNATDPLKESVEDGTVRLSFLGDISQSVSSRQQSDEPGGSALCPGGDVKEKRPAVQLRRGDGRGVKERSFLGKVMQVKLIFLLPEIKILPQYM